MKLFSSMKVKFGNKKNANKAKLYCSEYGFYQSGSFRSDYETKQFKDKKDFANAIVKYLNNPNTYIERLEVDNGVAGSLLDNKLVMLNMIIDELKG